MIDKLNTIKVVKRNGRRVEFDGSKIAIAIKKGFDSVDAPYGLDDVNKVYNKVILQIRKQEKDSIKIEQIQDLIEQELQKNGYTDVYQSFAEYRERRAKSREAFSDEKRLHKFLKLIEKLGLKEGSEENTTLSNKNAYDTMLEFGSTLSKEFSKTYLMKKSYSDAHDNGDIYIHDIDFIPMGTTESCKIDLSQTLKNKEYENIGEYLNDVGIMLSKVKKDQHGEQTIPELDTYLAPAVLETFKEQLKQTIDDLLEFSDFDKFIATSGIEREIDRINTIEIDATIFDKYTRESSTLKKMFAQSIQKAIQKTEKIVSKTIGDFLERLSETQECSICFGLDTSKEGHMISKNILQEAPKRPNLTFIFKIKQGVNSKENEPNYDLLKMASKLQIMYVFQDTTFNKNSKVAYTKTARYAEDCPGRLSTTTINLPRLGLKYAGGKIEEFYQELDEKLELIKDQLLERFDEQCSKLAGKFPQLIGQGIWQDGEKLDAHDRLRRILKQGDLAIGFIGLAECIKALTRKKPSRRKYAWH